MPFKIKPELYSIWQGMKRRCDNPSFKQWKDYGGRGIKVCEQWANSYACFAKDMGPRPHGYTLDRIDNNGNYEPSNCRWSSRSEQQRNQRVTRTVDIEGRSYVAVELAKISGLKTDSIVARAEKGLSLQEILAKEKRYYMQGLALGGLYNGIKQRAKTHCKNGHLFDEKNTAPTKTMAGTIGRRCRKCHAMRQALRNNQ